MFLGRFEPSSRSSCTHLDWVKEAYGFEAYQRQMIPTYIGFSAATIATLMLLLEKDDRGRIIKSSQNLMTITAIMGLGYSLYVNGVNVKEHQAEYWANQRW